MCVQLCPFLFETTVFKFYNSIEREHLFTEIFMIMVFFRLLKVRHFNEITDLWVFFNPVCSIFNKTDFFPGNIRKNVNVESNTSSFKIDKLLINKLSPPKAG